ncbi:MAG TPA: hypothetical protein PKA98_06565 [Acidimicrobiales bacterium]|nr:hypothetical protein [Acidimicrobiales bacterium]
MRVTHRARTRAVPLAGVLVALVLTAAGPAGAAGAHGGAGQITLVQVEETSAGTVALEVCVVFTLDREQADTARVTMSATGPGDGTVEPVPMAVGDQPGLRNGEIELPTEGSWTIQVESTFPPAVLAVPVTIDEDLPLDAGLGTPPSGAAVAATCEPEDEALPSWLVAGLGTAGAVVLFGGLLLLLRRATAPAMDQADDDNVEDAEDADPTKGGRPRGPSRALRP